MRTPTTSHHLLRRFALGILAAAGCALPARAQFVSTAITNLVQPAGVAVDANDNVYITDPGNYRIAEYVPATGALTSLAGSPGNYGALNGPGSIATFFIPQGIVAARGGLVVADQGSQLIRFVTFDGTVSTLAGQAFVSGAVNGQGTNASFSYPQGIAADGAGNIFVADSQNNAIRQIDTNNNVTTVPVGGYAFDLPNAVAVDDYSNIWVADSGHDVICMISNGAVTVVAGVSGHAGTNDSLTATSALFDSPSGLLWVSSDNLLLISDSANDTIRSLFQTNYGGSTSYAVETVAGLPRQPGLQDGTLAQARFAEPIGLCIDPTDFGFYVADSGNNVVRALQASAPQPPVNPPVFGYVTFPASADPPYTSVFVASSAAVFNNLTNIVIDAEEGTETYISYGPTGSAIPQPGPNTTTAPIYPGNGTPPSQIASAISPGPGTNDITIYAVSVQSGRRSSPVVSARFQFVTANPVITGNNAADILLTDLTAAADMYYTINGKPPTNDGSSFGPVTSGAVLSLDITTNVLLQVRAFTEGLATSQTVSAELSVSNVVGNQMTWGFANGLASTHYITGLNLGFSAPVTFTGIPSSLPIYTFQFDLTVTNGGGTPLPVLKAGNFIPHLVQPDPQPPEFKLLPPGIFDPLTDTTNAGISTTQPDSLEVAWLVTPPVSNLYTSTFLLEYSGIFQTLFILDPPTSGALVGELQFFIPPTATPGTPFTLVLGAPSASSFNAPECCGPPINVLVQAPTNGPLTGTGLNAVKLVTVLTNNSPESAHLVGDVFPFDWFNIGDFGDSVLLDDDVIQTMEFAFTDPFALPANNPYFDAMDSSDGTVNNFFSTSDAAIDLITNGDGLHRRVRRLRDVAPLPGSHAGQLLPVLVGDGLGANRLSVSGARAAIKKASPTPRGPVKMGLSGPESITVAADQVQAGGNLTVQVPVRVLAAAPQPVRVFMFNAVIEPLDGSPPIDTSVSFSAATNLGSPYATASQTPNNYGAAWLDSSVAGVSGTNILGTLTVTLAAQCQRQFGLLGPLQSFLRLPQWPGAVFQATVQDGLITVGNRTGSSWQRRHSRHLALALFRHGVQCPFRRRCRPRWRRRVQLGGIHRRHQPSERGVGFQVSAGRSPAAAPPSRCNGPRWSTKIIRVQSSILAPGGWTTVASNLIGNGQAMQWTDTNAGQRRPVLPRHRAVSGRRYWMASSCLIWNFSTRLRKVARVMPSNLAARTWLPLVSNSA